MKVNLYATYHVLSGVRTFDLDLPPGATLRQAVDAILLRYPTLKEHWLSQSGDPHSFLLIFVNGHELSTLDAQLNTPLYPLDTLDFLPPVAGG
jgi:molybdopterin converting factor small subunit